MKMSFFSYQIEMIFAGNRDQKDFARQNTKTLKQVMEQNNRASNVDLACSGSQRTPGIFHPCKMGEILRLFITILHGTPVSETNGNSFGQRTQKKFYLLNIEDVKRLHNDFLPNLHRMTL